MAEGWRYYQNEGGAAPKSPYPKKQLTRIVRAQSELRAAKFDVDKSNRETQTEDVRLARYLGH